MIRKSGYSCKRNNRNNSKALELPQVEDNYIYNKEGQLIQAIGGGVIYRYDYTPSGRVKSKKLNNQQVLEYVYTKSGKFDSGAAARDAFQVATEWSDCKVRGTFDTLQIVDDMYVPTTLGNTTKIPEPFTISYPEYGKGGIQQYRVDKIVEFRNVEIIGD